MCGEVISSVDGVICSDRRRGSLLSGSLGHIDTLAKMSRATSAERHSEHLWVFPRYSPLKSYVLKLVSCNILTKKNAMFGGGKGVSR
jgi:hypothetical protein